MIDENILNIIKQWQRGRGNIIVDNELSTINFEPQYKIVKSNYLYRGFWAKYEARDSLEKSGYFEYKGNYRLTSWSTSPKIAILFAQGFYSKKDREQIYKRHGKGTILTSCGIAIRVPTKELNILVNLNTLPYHNKYRFQKEVIVVENNSLPIQRKDVIYCTWRDKHKDRGAIDCYDCE